MINKLPGWVETGGFLLALNAGFINAVGLLGFEHQAVSHLTGISTFLSLELAKQNFPEVFHLLLVMLCFVLGAAYSGMVVGNTALKLGRRYSVALITESLLLGIAMLLLVQGRVEGHFFASAACGLQNAMTTSYSGAIVRTTHVSGLFTDLGVALGLRLRGQRTDSRKIRLYVVLIAGFVLGGIAGATGFIRYQFLALWMPCLLTLLVAVLYWWFVYRGYKE